MPTQQPITASLSPKEEVKPLPVITVSTRPRVKPQVNANVDQSTITEEKAVASAPVESVKLSPQLSALARKEQAFRQREQALKERETQLESRLAEAEKFTSLKAKLSSKDFSEVEALGLNYEEYTQYLLAKQNGGQVTKESEALKKLEDEVTALKKSQEDSATQEYEATVAEYKKEIASIVASNPDFASIKELSKEDAVLQLILDSWEEDETELTVEEASKQVEAYLVEEASKMAGLTKIKSKLGQSVEDKKPLPKPGIKTLTNNVTVGSEKVADKPFQKLSDEERYAEARRRVMARRQQS